MQKQHNRINPDKILLLKMFYKFEFNLYLKNKNGTGTGCPSVTVFFLRNTTDISLNLNI